MKVLHSVLSLEVGGLENGVVNLVNCAPDDIQVDILCLRATGALVERITNPRAKVIPSPTLSDHSIRAAVMAHWQCIEQSRYDIVHTHGWATMLTGALACWASRWRYWSNRPLIINGEHGVYYDQSRRQRTVQKWLFQNMDGNLSVSADLGRRMEQAFQLSPNTFQTILNGVDTQRFFPKPEVRRSRRQAWGFQDQHLVIGTVGRLVAIKNYPLLLAAFREIYKTFKHIRLVFCGDGDQRDHLQHLVQEYGLSDVVLFTGRIDYVADAMQAFDIFALTSDMEGLPNTLLEAMASGIPSVVTDVGGSREVMPTDGGVLVPPSNQAAFQAALQQLIENQVLRQDMAAKALQHVQTNLSMHAMASGYYNYYRSLVN